MRFSISKGRLEDTKGALGRSSALQLVTPFVVVIRKHISMPSIWVGTFIYEPLDSSGIVFFESISWFLQSCS
jgi:hypothetical protein